MAHVLGGSTSLSDQWQKQSVWGKTITSEIVFGTSYGEEITFCSFKCVE